MNKMLSFYAGISKRVCFLKSCERGQALVEYALILVTMSGVTLATTTKVGLKIADVFHSAAAAFR